MFAYADETGNTGANIFDPEQPMFMTAALLTKTNFDILHSGSLRTVAGSIGEVELHANELGIERVEKCAGQLLRIIKKADARFFVSRIEKRYLATTKLVDTLFDSYENKAVPWHVYNIRPLRLMTVFKVASILEVETAKKFWSALMEPNRDRAYVLLVESLKEISGNIERLPDDRSRDLIGESITWALNNTEAIYLHTSSKATRLEHLPNIVAFSSLLEGIEKCSQLWKRPVREIVHDRQSQFQKTLRGWHELTSNAVSGVIEWTLGEKISVRRVPGSSFRISSAQESAGIQMVDTILWLYRRGLEGKPVGEDSIKFMTYVFSRAHMHDMSFEFVGNRLEQFLAELNEKPFGPEDEARGREFLRIAEERRQRAMAEYAEDKLKSTSPKQIEASE